MLEVFPGRVLIEMDTVLETIGGIKVISKTKRRKNKGRIIDGEGFKKDDHVLFFPTKGVIMEGKCLIDKNDIVLILKDKGMKLLGKKILVEAQKSSNKVTANIVAAVNHIQILPIGVMLEIGEGVESESLKEAYKEKKKIMFDKDRATDLSIYELPDLKDKPVYMINESDVLSII